MSAAMPNVYGPAQLAALQDAFDYARSEIGSPRLVSRRDLAKLIMALAAGGGAGDHDAIDAEELAEEAFTAVVRLRQHHAWPGQSRLTAFRSLTVSDNWAMAQAG
jgi:hypothetical protein